MLLLDGSQAGELWAQRGYAHTSWKPGLGKVWESFWEIIFHSDLKFPWEFGIKEYYRIARVY